MSFKNSSFVIAGTLRTEQDTYIDGLFIAGNIRLEEGGTVKVRFIGRTSDSGLSKLLQAKVFTHDADDWFYYHNHKLDAEGNCVVCENSGDLGSVLSVGSVTVIVGVVCLAVGLGGGFFLGRRRKEACGG